MQEQPAPADRLSVDEAVQEALARNLAYRAESERIGAAEGQLRQARAAPNPVLTGSSGAERFYLNEAEGASVGVQFELETAGKRRLRGLTAAGDLERVRHEVGSAERDLITQTRKGYFALVKATRDLDLARETSATLRRVVDLGAERVKRGEAPGLELNLANVELARSLRSVQEAERQSRQASAAINLLMGRPPGALVVPTSDFSPALPASQSDPELLDYALHNRPEVLAAEDNLAARTAAAELAKSLRIPNLTWGLAYQWQRFIISGAGASAPNSAAQFLRRTDQQLVVDATVPLPFFNRNQGSIATAETERRAAEQRVGYVRQVVEYEIATALVNYRSRIATRALYEESVLSQLQKNLEAIQEAYRLGQENIFAVLQAQRTWFDSRREYLQTLLDLEIDRIDLEKAIGRPLR
jgi:cobalt-zinc-cadmium efflux system outer membrane protein